ncbi:MAG: metalloregulator ArsR/SmtB family transcription factor [Lactobacillaceae bacterium]|jgi:DNA-binding transcriptional ArsR family regulator|nr:metalloregulator ArsR/SmtB family transcription factor [Lactobacillaceae bacterium]
MSTKLTLIHQAKLDEAAKMAKILGNPSRMQILYILEQQTLNVTELSTALDIEQSQMSHTLKYLRDHQLISQERRGKSIYYTLDDPHIMSTMTQLLKHAEHVLANCDHTGAAVDHTVEVDL